MPTMARTTPKMVAHASVSVFVSHESNMIINGFILKILAKIEKRLKSVGMLKNKFY
jgi:hypothetical protein